MIFCLFDLVKIGTVLSGFLTLVIAGIAVYIAWQQHKTNRNQFRLALLERRLKVFNSTGELIGIAISRGKVENDDLMKFLFETRENEFLFGPDITAYLHELYSKASDVYSLEDAADEEQRRQRKEVLKWFSGQGDEAKKKFGVYMAFREV